MLETCCSSEGIRSRNRQLPNKLGELDDPAQAQRADAGARQRRAVRLAANGQLHHQVFVSKRPVCQRGFEPGSLHRYLDISRHRGQQPLRCPFFRITVVVLNVLEVLSKRHHHTELQPASKSVAIPFFCICTDPVSSTMQRHVASW